MRASGPLADVLGNVRLPVDMEEGAAVVLEGVVESVSPEWRSAMIRTDGWVFDAVAGNVPKGAGLRLRVLAAVEEIGEPCGPEKAYQIVKLRSREGKDVLLARILRESTAALGLKPGLPVWALVKATAVIA